MVLNNMIKFVLRNINQDDMYEMEKLATECNKDSFYEFNNRDEIISSLGVSLNEDDLLDVRLYTGTIFKDINNALRGTWNYEENGHIDRMNEAINKGRNASKIIHNNPHLPINFKTYRGVTIDAFKQYGILKLEDLPSLVGKYIYELGFTSTSLLRDKSFFKRKNYRGDECNIEIEYLVPDTFQDGILLMQNGTYSEDEYEYLIDASSLSRVLDVHIDNNYAKVTIIVFPKKMYDEYYKNYHQNKNKSK